MSSEIKNSRNMSIELLRMLLMIFIILHHFLVHGSQIAKPWSLPQSFGTYQTLIFGSLLLFPVNCFVLISGFFKITFKLHKIISFWLQGLFYSVIILIVFKLFSSENVSIGQVILSFFPVTRIMWWFFSCYFFLMLLSPVLNYLCDTLPKKELEYILFVGVILNLVVSFINNSPHLGAAGSSLMNFIFIYMLGRYLRIYKGSINIPRYLLLIIFVLSVAVIAVLSILSVKFLNGDKLYHLYSFNNPLIVIQAVCIFYLFHSFNINLNIIVFFSSSVFAVYLIHDHPSVRNFIYNNIFKIYNYSESPAFIPLMILYALIIFIVAILIEKIRLIIFNPLIKYLSKSKYLKDVELKIPLK